MQLLPELFADKGYPHLNEVFPKEDTTTNRCQVHPPMI